MKKAVSKKEFITAENNMNNLLAIVTQKGGFDYLTKKESAELNRYTQIVKTFEDCIEK